MLVSVVDVNCRLPVTSLQSSPLDGASLNVKGKLYSACVQCVMNMIYGSETWAMKADDMQRLVRAERMMILI